MVLLSYFSYWIFSFLGIFIGWNLCQEKVPVNQFGHIYKTLSETLLLPLEFSERLLTENQIEIGGRLSFREITLFERSQLVKLFKLVDF
ncbi:hypothetical protein HDU92_008362 [Lobulomyces angularis]|nr:hypothetical protein HDU92_008362 [Lobulomyces angularis]